MCLLINNLEIVYYFKQYELSFVVYNVEEQWRSKVNFSNTY